MRILDRYIFKELLVPFVLGIAIFTSILLIARILKLIEMVVNRGVPLFQMLKLFSYILPAFLEITVPMALLLAVLVALGRLSSDSEIIALQASGIGLSRIAAPVGLFACGVLLLTLLLSLYVRPWGNTHLRLGLYDIVKARASAGIKAKVFNDDFLGLVIYVDHIEPPGHRLRGILISDLRGDRDNNTIFARYGLVVTSEETQTLTLRLLDGGIYTTSGRSSRSYQDTRFSTYDINLDLNIALVDLKRRDRDPAELSFYDLLTAIRTRLDAGQAALPERVELHRKFAIPFACLVFAALALPLGIRPARSVHSWGFATSLVLIFAYYLLLTLGQSLGERGALPPALAMWMANGILALIAAFLLIRAGQGKALAAVSIWDRCVTHIRGLLSARAPS